MLLWVRTLALETRGTEFEPEHPCKKLGILCVPASAVLGIFARQTWRACWSDGLAKKVGLGPGGMAQWPRVLTSLTEDLGSVPSTNMMVRNHLYLQVWDI